MPPKTKTPDVYADLPVDVRRQALIGHRQALLTDRLNVDLQLQRLTSDPSASTRAQERVDELDALIASTTAALEALPSE